MQQNQEIRSKHITDKTSSLTAAINFSDEKSLDPKLQQFRKIISAGQLVKLDPNDIKTNENIRKKINTECLEFKQLVESIRQFGILQSIIVEYREKNHKEYDLVCVSGHRRLAALKEANTLEKIPAKLIMFDRKGASTSIALSENVNRQNLHFIELADTYHSLIENEEMSVSDIVKLFDKNERTVKRYLTMASWNDKIKKLILDNTETFPLRYVWDHFISRKKTEDEILAELQSKLKQPSIEKVARTSAKQKRKLKLEKYYAENKVNSAMKKELEKVLRYLNLI